MRRISFLSVLLLALAAIPSGMAAQTPLSCHGCESAGEETWCDRNGGTTGLRETCWQYLEPYPHCTFTLTPCFTYTYYDFPTFTQMSAAGTYLSPDQTGFDATVSLVNSCNGFLIASGEDAAIPPPERITL